MPHTKAFPAPSTYEAHVNVVQLPPEAKPLGLATKSALIVAAQQAIEFHEGVVAYHARQAANFRDQLAKLKGRA